MARRRFWSIHFNFDFAEKLTGDREGGQQRDRRQGDGRDDPQFALALAIHRNRSLPTKTPHRPPPGRTKASVPRAQQRRTGSGALRHRGVNGSALRFVPLASDWLTHCPSRACDPRGLNLSPSPESTQGHRCRPAVAIPRRASAFPELGPFRLLASHGKSERQALCLFRIGGEGRGSVLDPGRLSPGRSSSRRHAILGE
jgi:hypothetical protein